MNSLIENKIIEFISDKSIIKRTTLSEAFNMKCERIILNDETSFVVKYYQDKNIGFNSIKSEGNSLIFLTEKFPLLFPNIKFLSKDLLIIDFIEHNNLKKNDYEKILAKEIVKLHKIRGVKYGFDFDAQIGGLKQSNTFDSNWINFFRDNRLNMIFEIINKNDPMPKHINVQIENLIKNLENRIPKHPKVSLLHGDLWEGNILFNDGRLVGLIDPGIYFGHNELEIAYLTWFKFVSSKFINCYSEEISIDKNFNEYEPIYQLYFSLLNIHLWSREYIKDTEFLLKKIF